MDFGSLGKQLNDWMSGTVSIGLVVVGVLSILCIHLIVCVMELISRKPPKVREARAVVREKQDVDMIHITDEQRRTLDDIGGRGARPLGSLVKSASRVFQPTRGVSPVPREKAVTIAREPVVAKEAAGSASNPKVITPSRPTPAPAPVQEARAVAVAPATLARAFKPKKKVKEVAVPIVVLTSEQRRELDRRIANREMYSEQEVATLFGVQVDAVYRWAYAKKLVAVPIDHEMWVDAKSLESLVLESAHEQSR